MYVNVRYEKDIRLMTKCNVTPLDCMETMEHVDDAAVHLKDVARERERGRWIGKKKNMIKNGMSKHQNIATCCPDLAVLVVPRAHSQEPSQHLFRATLDKVDTTCGVPHTPSLPHRSADGLPICR